MKILYPIIDGEISGGNIVCLRIMEEALKRGYRVMVNSPTEGKFTCLLGKRGIRVYNIDTRRSFQFVSAIKLSRIIKREGINLVHSHTPLAGVFLSRLAGWMAGVPVITHAHTKDFLSQNHILRAYQFSLNWVTSRFFCAKVIAVSKSVKNQIIKQGVASHKIIVVYNGVSLDEAENYNNSIRIRKEFGLRQNQPIIGTVGRLCKDKGQRILIQAAPKVIKKIPDAVFMIVGENPAQEREYKDRLEDLAHSLGVKQYVIFTGYRADIMELMNAFEFFVLPSSVEGLPVVILEAMAAKKAVITTSVGGNPEIVVDGETGTLIPPEDPDKLAEAIIYHLENLEISKRMGENGCVSLRRHFSLLQMLSGIMNVYEQVVKGRQWRL